MIGDDSDVALEELNGRRKRRKKRVPATDAVESANETLSVEPEAPKPQTPGPILMVEVENVTHDKFRQTEEVKVRLFSRALPADVPGGRRGEVRAKLKTKVQKKSYKKGKKIFRKRENIEGNRAKKKI